MAITKIKLKTEDGPGEAIRCRFGAWLVSLPTGDFRFFGSVAEVKAEVKRRLIIQKMKETD